MNRLNPFLLLLSLLLVRAEAALPAFPGGKFTVESVPGAIEIHSREGTLVSRYQLTPPQNQNAAPESAAYFHPIATPSGIVLTDVSPPDHKHHRGLFLAWVEMHGSKDADFWGWGQHAPKEKRVIQNIKVEEVHAAGASAGFRAFNEWRADSETMIKEDLTTLVRSTATANVFELTYSLEATAELRLAKWAFSGFCVRFRKDGQIEAFGPDGTVTLPDPHYLKPETDWPDAPWYDFTLTLPDGKKAGIAIIQHPGNPTTLWHNHRATRMLNPCIVAPGEVKMQPGKPMVLRYRVVAHDGPPPVEFLKKLVREWQGSKTGS